MDLETLSPDSTKTRLSDEALALSHPAVLVLVTQLEDVARRDPSPGTAEVARALADYFRTAD